MLGIVAHEGDAFADELVDVDADASIAVDEVRSLFEGEIARGDEETGVECGIRRLLNFREQCFCRGKGVVQARGGGLEVFIFGVCVCASVGVVVK